jgi:hypothetical protein
MVRRESRRRLEPGPRWGFQRPSDSGIWREVRDLIEAQEMKSANCISAIGRRPIIAAPIAAPTIADSEMGVSMTRFHRTFQEDRSLL